MQHMRSMQHKWKWYLRKHIAERICDPKLRWPKETGEAGPREEGQKPSADQAVNSWHRVGTLNIKGARSKKYELRNLLERYSIDCLALQETLIRATDWNLNVAGYHYFSVCGDNVASKRGVEILLKNKMSGYVVGTSSPWHIFIRCFGKGPRDPMDPWCVYISHRGTDAREAIRLVKDQLRKLQADFPNEPIAVMGEWNRTALKTGSIVREVDEDVLVMES